MAKPFKRSQTEDSQPTSISEPTPEASSTNGGYDPDRISTRAYELYMDRGGGHGNDMDDWLTAERELSNGDSQAAENLRKMDD
jgi:hypothetical protein